MERHGGIESDGWEGGMVNEKRAQMHGGYEKRESRNIERRLGSASTVIVGTTGYLLDSFVGRGRNSLSPYMYSVVDAHAGRGWYSCTQ